MARNDYPAHPLKGIEVSEYTDVDGGTNVRVKLQKGQMSNVEELTLEDAQELAVQLDRLLLNIITRELAHG